MYRKISCGSLSNVALFPVQGGSRSTLYSASYEGHEVVVKVEDGNADPDRFDQALRILEEVSPLSPNLVDYYGNGDDWETGSRFVVIEKLNPLPPILPTDTVESIVGILLETSYLLYSHGLNWIAAKKHVLLSSNNVVKLVDFNDENGEEDCFFKRYESCYDTVGLIQSFLGDYGLSTQILDRAINSLFTSHYQALENVHQPIYFTPFKDTLRTESEAGDPQFGKLVPANRKCTDRALMLAKNIDFASKSYLDIGSNVGWFCFHIASSIPSARVTGIEYDLEKVEFSTLLADWSGLRNVKFSNVDVNMEYVISSRGSKVDIISMMSLLHLYFTQHRVSSDYWKNMVQAICERVNETFIVETSPVIFRHLHISNWLEFMDLIVRLGGFTSSAIIGYSGESNRPVIVFKK